MDIENLKKVEIGCGKTKTEGYIGVDRFELDGVDIVADINEGLPFETNSVDVIFACHSLEHMENLQNVMDEIFRISKHGAIINILAPYYNTYTNIANFFHKINFNEDTMRFFSSEETSVINLDEYYNAHSYNWGLATSDNSELSCNLTILDMEFFYFPEYNFLNDDEKRNARRSLSNVCDQIYYSLVVNKEKKPFEVFEIEYYRELAKKLTPPVVNAVRINSSKNSERTSFYSDILHRINKFKNENAKELEEETKFLKEGFQKQLKEIKLEMLNDLKVFKMKIEEDKLVVDNIKNQILEINDKVKDTKHNRIELSAYIHEIMKSNESKIKGKLFNRKNDLFSQLRVNWSNFCDLLIFNQENFKNESILGFSQIIPFDSYFEYKFSGEGELFNYFISAMRGSTFLFEIVENNKIIHNQYIYIEKEGHQSLKIPKISGEIYIRFRALNNYSIGRLLEIKNRRKLFFIKNDIAAYFE